MYRACFADGSELRVRHGRDADGRGDPRRLRRGRGRRPSAGSATGSTRLYDLEMPQLHRPQLRLAARPASARSRPALRARRAWAAFGKLAQARRAATSTTSGCGASSASSPCTPGLAPVRGAGDLRRHHVHGHRQRRVRPRGRHARAPDCAGRRGREGRGEVPLRHAASSASCSPTARRAGPGRAARRRRADRGRRRGRATPTCRSPTARCCPGLDAATRDPPRARTRPRPWCGTSACGATLPAGAAHHNIHFGARVGRARSGRSSRDGDPHARPVAAGQRADAARADDGPGRSPRPLRARAGARTSTAASTGPPSAPRCREPSSRPRSPRSATRSTSRSSELVDPLDWEAPGHGAGHAVRARRTRSARPGPFRPGNVERRAPGWCSPAPAPCPASACRWCWCRASWPPNGSSAMEAR